MLDRRRTAQQWRRFDDGRRRGRPRLLDQVDVQDPIRRRVSDARGPCSGE